MISTWDVGAVRVVRIERDAKRNALSILLCDALLEALSVRGGGTRCVVLTGAGSVFCAGADLSETDFQGGLYPAVAALLEGVQRCPVPVVAYVNGPAIGAGMMLAMACDLRVVSPSARFVLPVADQAIGVDAWPVSALVSLVGESRARAMLLAGMPLSAAEAVDCGFAVRSGTLEDALGLARHISEKAPLTLANVKQQLAPWLFTESERAAGVEQAWASVDRVEAGRAFLEKRRPAFRGE